MTRAPNNPGSRGRLRRFPAAGVLATLAIAAAGASPTKPTSRPAADVRRAVADLKSDDWIVQYRAISQLARWGAVSARQPLEAVLTGKAHPWVRGRALVALGRIFGERMLDRALAHTRSETPELRAAAVETLGVIGSPKGQAVAVAALEDKAPDVRCQGVLALARLRKAGAWPLIQPLLKQPDPKLIRHVAIALRSVGTDAAVEVLVGLADHDDEQVRLEAVGSLGRFRRPEHVGKILYRMAKDDSQLVRQRAAKALAAFPAGVLHREVLAAMGTGDNDIHSAGVRVLARKPDPATGDAVAKLINTPDHKFGSALGAMLAYLASVEPDRYHAIFTRHLTHSYSNVRQDAIRAVAKCRKIDRFAALKPLLADKSSSVRGYVIDALKAEPDPPPKEGWVRYLSGALNCDTWDTRKRAVLLIAERVRPAELGENFAEFQATLGGEHAHVRDLAAKTLGKVADEPTRRRIAAAQGYVTDWRVIGPFPNDRQNRGFGVVYPPEVECDFEKTCPEHRLADGAVFEATGGVAGQPTGLRIATPPGDRAVRTVATFFVELPADQAKLTMAVSAPAASGAKHAAKFAVLAAGRPLGPELLLKPGDANALTLRLAGRDGTKCQLDLAVWPANAAGAAVAVNVARPRVAAGAGKAIDLAAMASAAAVRTEPAGREPKQIRWQARQVVSASGELPLHDIFNPPTHYHVAYAAADLTAPAGGSAFLEIEADDGCIVWLNGKEVFRAPAKKAGRAAVTLQPGANRLLVKVANLLEWWYVKVRVADKDGRRAAAVRPGP